MIMLDNGKVRVDVDEMGRIAFLSTPDMQNVISTPVDLFHANVHLGDNWENSIFEKDQQIKVSASENCITVSCDQLMAKDGILDISVKLVISANDDKLNFESEIDNRSSATVVDWYYPCIGRIDQLDDGVMSLYFPRHLGEKYVNIGEYLRSLNRREALHTLSEMYPGYLSMQWMMLEGSQNTLYLSGRDDLFHTSSQRAVGSKTGGVILEMNKMAFVKPGEKWVCPKYLLWLYQGSWREGAKEYRTWAQTWRYPVKPKNWIKKMNGYFLVINKQQYGDIIWPYDTMPELWKFAQAHGFDTLGLFGWYDTGHDNNYPDLKVSEEMGGAEELKRQIRFVQQEGGHVTLYNQGHLIDVCSNYYQKEGKKLEGKSRWGTGYHEVYDKFCGSDYLRFFSKKIFTTACPSCRDWQELMAKKADWIHSFGADGILYDQIGGMPPYPCFDESHHHLQSRPSLSHVQGRIQLHKRIRQQVDSYQDYAYMSEHVTDVHSQFIDCLHGIGSYPGAEGNDAATSNIVNWDVPSSRGKSVTVMFPDIFRFTFPETLITIRNPNPYVTRRYANYATFYGFKLEMELRYISDKEYIEADEGKEDRKYVKKNRKLPCFL